jgi:hypothetical protein
MKPTDLMTKDEVRVVLFDLRRRALRSFNSRANLTIFRLSACYGPERVNRFETTAVRI